MPNGTPVATRPTMPPIPPLTVVSDTVEVIVAEREVTRRITVVATAAIRLPHWSHLPGLVWDSSEDFAVSDTRQDTPPRDVDVLHVQPAAVPRGIAV